MSRHNCINVSLYGDVIINIALSSCLSRMLRLRCSASSNGAHSFLLVLLRLSPPIHCITNTIACSLLHPRAAYSYPRKSDNSCRSYATRDVGRERNEKEVTEEKEKCNETEQLKPSRFRNEVGALLAALCI